MSEPFLGEIKMFAGNFAPRGFANCDGQLLAVSQNDALFSLFGTIYGGDGRTTFGLPDLRGRIPVHTGTGPGLSPRILGQKAGAENVALSTTELPPHTHAFQASADPAGETRPAGNTVAGDVAIDLYAAPVPPVAMDPASTVATGGGDPHTNLQPFLCIRFIVALVGIYPSRT